MMSGDFNNDLDAVYSPIKQKKGHGNKIIPGSPTITRHGNQNSKETGERWPSEVNGSKISMISAIREDTAKDDDRSGIEQGLNEVDIKKFVSKNLTLKECNKYIPASKDPKCNTCGCGKDIQWHTDKDMLKGGLPVDKWTSKECTKHIPCGTYGTINFGGSGNNTSHAPYVRVHDEEDVEQVWNLMHDHWRRPAPKLIISVTGGAKSFSLKNKLKECFKRGLVKVAATENTWIITGGTNTGVMKFVGDAVKQYSISNDRPIVSLGIVTWGIIENKEALEEPAFPAFYAVDNEGNSRTAALNPNHSHFIFVDDGTDKKFGKEISFRAKFEQYLQQKMERGAVVLLVLEGGPNTLKTAMSAIKQDTPVVVIKGSGRAADFIAKGLKETKCVIENGQETTQYTRQFDETFLKYAEEMFDWSHLKQDEIPVQIKQCLENLKALLDYRHKITVFTLDDPDTTDEIDQAILDALLSAQKSSITEQLKLALAWNRCDVAREKILTVQNRAHLLKKKDGLNEAMFEALARDREDFVQLLLDNGVVLKNFLTKDNLKQLYNDVMFSFSRSSGLIRSLLQRMSAGFHKKESRERVEIIHLKQIGKLIGYLLGDKHRRLYQGNKKNKNNSYKSRKDYPKQSQDQENDKEICFENPAKELFLWAVLLNRKGLAKLFWKIGKDHIGAALTASTLLQQLAIEAGKEVEIDLKTDIENHAKTFENYAIGVLNKCYLKDKDKSHQLVIRKLEQWGGKTLFTLSDSAAQMDFMGHACCQTKLNQIWNGKMAVHTRRRSILLSLVIPFMLPFITFHSEPVIYYEVSVNDNPNTMLSNIDKKPRNEEKSPKLRVDIYAMIKTFMYFHKAPVTKFLWHHVSYLIFLGLFSYMILVEISSIGWPKAVEIIVCLWNLTLMIEELRQVLTTRSLKAYLSSQWNIFDLLISAAFILCVILRLTLPTEHFVWARMGYSVTLILYYFRFLQAFLMSENIGPKIIMIKKMLTDLSLFLCILSVFTVAYGVASHALQYQNSPFTVTLLKDIVYKPYWNIYGELFLDELNGDIASCTTNVTALRTDSTLQSCPEKNALVLILFAAYMIFSNVLLLNLLIAMFSYSFVNIQGNSEKVWRYYRYSLIYEYWERPTLAPPLIIINHLYRIYVYFTKTTREGSNDFMKTFNEQDDNELTVFERLGMENFLHDEQVLAKKQIDAKVHNTGERIEKVLANLECIKEDMGPKYDSDNVGGNGTLSLNTGNDSENDITQLQTQQKVILDNVSQLQKRMDNLEESFTLLQDKQQMTLNLLQESIKLQHKQIANVSYDYHMHSVSAVPAFETYGGHGSYRSGRSSPSSMSVSPNRRTRQYNYNSVPQIEIQDVSDSVNNESHS